MNVIMMMMIIMIMMFFVIRHTQPLCTASPAETFWKFGLLAPFLAILILILLGKAKFRLLDRIDRCL